jgi:hypothetical protein
LGCDWLKTTSFRAFGDMSRTIRTFVPIPTRESNFHRVIRTIVPIVLMPGKEVTMLTPDAWIGMSRDPP